jgi:hypothetical protein
MHRSAASEFHVMEWGIESQIVYRVGGGVRFRHSLIQRTSNSGALLLLSY